MKRKAIIIGSATSVGQALMHELCALYDTVMVITRTQPAMMSENMHVYHIPDFNGLSELMATIPIGSDTDAFSCLGIAQKDAVSQDEFYQVNVLFNIMFAKSCHDKGVRRFFYLSKAGVDKPNQQELIAKADVEYFLKSLQFEHLLLFRPTALIQSKPKLSIKSLTAFGVEKAKDMAKSVISLGKNHAISPTKVAMAMSLSAYHLNLRRHHKYHANTEYATQVIEHQQICAMTELHSQNR